MTSIDEKALDKSALVATRGTSDKATDGDRVLEALALVDGLKDDFKVRDNLFREVEKAIFLANDVYIPKKYRRTTVEVRSPQPVHSTNTITAALSINPPSVHFNAEPAGDTGQENKELRQNFFEASWRLQEQEAERRLFRMFVYSTVVFGEGVMKTVERSQRSWAGYYKFADGLRKKLNEDDSYKHLDGDGKRRVYDQSTEDYKRGCAYPIASMDVLPQTFYYVKGEDGFSTAVEDKQVAYYDALDQNGLSLDKDGKVTSAEFGLPSHEWHEVMGKSRFLRMIEIWRWDRCWYILQGPGDIGNRRRRDFGSGYMFKEIRDHGYCDPERRVLNGPYFHAYGQTTNSREHGKAGMSVLFGYLDLFKLLDSLLTIQSNAAHMFGFPIWRKTSAPGAGIAPNPFARSAGDLANQDKAIEPGDIMPYDLAPLEPPRGSDALDKSINMTKTLLEPLLPGVVQGVVSGDMAGYAINQAAHLARLAWDPLLDNIEFAFSKRTSFESRLIERNIGEPVYAPALESTTRRSRTKVGAGHLRLGPNDLKGVHVYTVQLDPEMPSDQVVETRTWREKLELGVASKKQAIEALGGDPRKVEKDNLVQMIKDSDVMTQLLIKRVVQNVATVDTAAMEESGAPTTGGAPQAAPAPAGGDMNVNVAGGAPVAPGGAAPQPAPTPNPRAPGGAPAAVQGGAPGTPVTPSLPGNSLPLPGQG